MNLLEYENQMFLDAFHDDGLLVTARGLGIERVFVSFLKLYCDPGNLVLVLNTSHNEEEYFLEQLQNSGTNPLPMVVTNEYNADQRQKLYMDGGVLFITSRILVVDMLTERMPTHLITGILVHKAHRIIESCQEAFILRLYRQKNKTGFIKAFSESAQSYTSGFSHVERVMKSLFIRKLFLWPRFHASIVTTMEKHKVDVVELHVPMTTSMLACQTALLDIISGCVKELKRGNPTLDTDEITVEYALTRNFEKIVKLHLDPVWHQLSGKTKQLITDLKTLRLLLEYLTQYDCVTFYNLVNSIRTSEKTFGQNSGWLFMDSADSLFVTARQRLFTRPKETKTKKQKTSSADKGSSSEKESVPNPEESPKWVVLAEVLQEINTDNKSGEPSRVLIAAQDDRTCSQIKEYLCEGGPEMLQRLFNKTIASKSGNKIQPMGGQSKSGRDKGPTKPVNALTLTQMVDTMDDREVTKDEGESCGLQLSSPDAYSGVLSAPMTVIHPLYGSADPNSLVCTLHEVEPKYVVLYDADMQFVRQLEVFRASRPGKPLRVYFLMYTGSTEEQRYLTTLRKEKEAFEYLIREKATMVIPEERDGRMADDPNLAADPRAANTRKGGQDKPKEKQKVIVDMREFRSELPSLIHRREMDIEPVTIEVGDYILTPDICVERKSLSDLIGSLNSGRLYNQAVAMCRYYKRPILLIEFDPNKSFALQGKYSIFGEMTSTDTMSKLTLLTIHFPRLRILWCQSPYATAQLFEELKLNRPQPSAADAMAITSEVESELDMTKYSHGPQTMLLKMPGINTKNIHKIMSKVKDMSELVTLSQEQLSDILDSGIHAGLLHNFLHHKHKSAEIEAAKAKISAGKKGAINKWKNQ